MPQQEITIRTFNPADKSKIREICCDTAFMGEPVEAFFEDRDAFADIAISYYTDYEPQSLFVAQAEGKAIGYLAGCKDTRRFKKIFSRKILPLAVLRMFLRGSISKKKNLRFLASMVRSFLRGELRGRDCVREFPAHLHINVLPAYRRWGAGKSLIEEYVRYLKDNNVGGLHLYSFSAAGQEFFAKLNFVKIFSRQVSYFSYLTCRQISVSCFAKRLS